MDSKDTLIIEELRKDGRASIKDISKITGIRPSTVHQRIQRLLRDGTIEKFTIKTSDDAIGEPFTAFLLIKGNTQKYLPSRIVTDPHVKEVFGVTGEYDLLLKLKFRDVKEFNDYIIAFRQEHPQIQATLTMVGTAKIKEEV
ncbi:MAG: hypothetical protein A2Z88_07160 [Omnitrophica WOR_2 bacterium GWA2_47_8]|nr:MAG: hypothetical protein A2Z88_07160 [Omnitrophica WOR_2 bacterium GWA2_47_8]